MLGTRTSFPGSRSSVAAAVLDCAVTPSCGAARQSEPEGEAATLLGQRTAAPRCDLVQHLVRGAWLVRRDGAQEMRDHLSRAEWIERAGELVLGRLAFARRAHACVTRSEKHFCRIQNPGSNCDALRFWILLCVCHAWILDSGFCYFARHLRRRTPDDTRDRRRSQ